MAIRAHNGGRDFVADRIAENRRVTGTSIHPVTHPLLYRSDTFLAIEEGDMLFPWQAHHDTQTVPLRSIQEPARWHGVRADHVQTVCSHLSKVLLDNFRIVVLIAVLINMEGSIGDTTDIQLLI